MELTEKTLSRRDIFEGKVVSLHVDTVELPDGKTSIREVVEHVDGVAVLALDENNNVLTVTQYRYVFAKPMLELPAGKLDGGEEPRIGALRELKEETGAVPDTLESLGHIVLSPGCFGETLHLFLARGLHMGQQHLDEGEFLNVERIPFDELYRRCMDGDVDDAKTVTAVLKAKLLLDL
jgi:ADP-ribose pyrophosphatase